MLKAARFTVCPHNADPYQHFLLKVHEHFLDVFVHLALFLHASQPLI